MFLRFGGINTQYIVPFPEPGELSFRISAGTLLDSKYILWPEEGDWDYADDFIDEDEADEEEY